MAGSKSGSAAAEPRPGARSLAARPVRWREILEQPQFFLVAVLALLCALFVWSAAAEVDQVIRVEGKIVPAARTQEIQHLEGGIVAGINCAEGQTVRKGDLLLTIDATSVGASLSETAVKLTGQRIRAARLEAEARGAGQLALPPELAATPSAQEERKLHESHIRKLEQELRVLDEQIRQRQADLNEAEHRGKRLAGELATARERSAMLDAMARRNAASRLEVLDAQSREQRLATEMSEAENSLPKIRAAIAETRARADEARARFGAQAQEDLVATRLEIERLQQIMTAQTDRVTRSDVRAPADGIINRVTTNTVGGVVKAGEVIVELTPSTGGLLIEARARPSDRGELRPGLESKVRITAYDSAALGSLTGRVAEVSADTVADSRGEPYYRVGIQIDALPERYAGKLLSPGMTITGDIVTNRRTVLRHILSPLTKFADNAFRDSR